MLHAAPLRLPAYRAAGAKNRGGRVRCRAGLTAGVVPATAAEDAPELIGMIDSLL